MFTVDFYAAPGTSPIKSLQVEAALALEAVTAARQHIDEVAGAKGFTVSDDLNAVVYSTFDPPPPENLEP